MTSSLVVSTQRSRLLPWVLRLSVGSQGCVTVMVALSWLGPVISTIAGVIFGIAEMLALSAWLDSIGYSEPVAIVRIDIQPNHQHETESPSDN